MNCEVNWELADWQSSQGCDLWQSLAGGPAASGVPQRLALGLVFLNISINDLDKGIEHTINKFDEDTKLGGEADIPEGYAAYQ